MIRVFKSNKGITLISMILAVIVIFIILGTISFSSKSSFQVRNLQNLFSDIEALNEEVSVYYIKNGILPVYNSYYDFDGNSQEYQAFSIKNSYLESNNTYYLNFCEANRTSNISDNLITYGILDISKLNGLTLNQKNNIPKEITSGKFFENRDDVAGKKRRKNDFRKVYQRWNICNKFTNTSNLLHKICIFRRCKILY